MFQILAGAFLVPFLLSCLDAVEVLPLPGLIENACYFVAGGGLVVGNLVFWPSSASPLY